MLDTGVYNRFRIAKYLYNNLMTETAEVEQSPEISELIPQEKIRPFANGLTQMFQEPMVGFRAAIPRLRQAFPGEEFAIYVEKGIGAISNTLWELVHSDQIWLTPAGKVTAGTTFHFSKRKDPEVKVPAGEVSIDEKLSKKILEACNDALRHRLTEVYASSEFLESQANSQEAKDIAAEIFEASGQIKDQFEGKFDKTSQIRVVTDEGGRSTIISVDREEKKEEQS